MVLSSRECPTCAQNGLSPLLAAASKGLTDLTEMLLHRGASLAIVDKVRAKSGSYRLRWTSLLMVLCLLSSCQAPPVALLVAAAYCVFLPYSPIRHTACCMLDLQTG
jgi:hypothetical protein